MIYGSEPTILEKNVKNMIKLQRSDIEKALTEIWQA
jgi:hypothetical protein